MSCAVPCRRRNPASSRGPGRGVHCPIPRLRVLRGGLWADDLVLVILNGEGTFTRSREQLHFARGDVVFLPSGEPFKADLKDFAYSLVRIPRDFLTAYAAEQLGQAARPVRMSRSPRTRGVRAHAGHEPHR